MPFFDSNGVKIHYEVAGEGPPIMLVHGFASSLNGNWVITGWVKRLVDAGRKTIALDCRGHGESDKPHEPGAYSGESMSGDVVNLMDHLAIEKADLFGYSMGGWISMELMTRHPQRFRRVVLGGVGSVSRGATESSAIASALSADDASAVSHPVGQRFREFAESQGNDLKALAACVSRPRSPLDAEMLGKVRLPVLVAVGEKDDLVGRADALVAAIPGARFVSIPDRDHLTVVPDPRFKEAILSFLAEEPFA
ncbi:MAG: alpha/beta hydrolase [Dehalococcoidia bacterium]|nr:alpha/beta hydrolase [Dehalococcoidia bacterium]